uniref:Uncharacterized protein n=1 Tax=Romanomermis culicivorax TaxID=13658 RepID=A0A915KAA5_ROMCU
MLGRFILATSDCGSSLAVYALVRTAGRAINRKLTSPVPIGLSGKEKVEELMQPVCNEGLQTQIVHTTLTVKCLHSKIVITWGRFLEADENFVSEQVEDVVYHIGKFISDLTASTNVSEYFDSHKFLLDSISEKYHIFNGTKNITQENFADFVHNAENVCHNVFHVLLQLPPLQSFGNAMLTLKDSLG